MAACTTPMPAPTTAPTAAPETTKAAESAAPAESAPPADLAFQKYDPPITISIIRTLDDTTKFISGEDINNNAWAKLYKDELGIILKYDWTASTAQQYDDKLNVNIASGMIPDIMEINKTQLARLAKTDLVNKDLQGVFDQYASPKLKEIITGRHHGDGFRHVRRQARGPAGHGLLNGRRPDAVDPPGLAG
jgi:putative aldouronate transport system substrate-binding protein